MPFILKPVRDMQFQANFGPLWVLRNAPLESLTNFEFSEFWLPS